MNWTRNWNGGAIGSCATLTMRMLPYADSSIGSSHPLPKKHGVSKCRLREAAFGIESLLRKRA